MCLLKILTGALHYYIFKLNILAKKKRVFKNNLLTPCFVKIIGNLVDHQYQI